jgi:hypothetical protein
MARRSNPTGQLPTSTVHQTRLPLFAPATRGVAVKKSFETNWGTVVFHRGSLTQRHRDVFDAIVVCHTRFERWPNAEGFDQITVEFDRASVLKMLGVPHNHTWLKEMLIDMAGVVAELKSQKGGIKANFISGLITARESLTGVALRKAGQFSQYDEDSFRRGGNSPLWTITMSPQLVALYDSDLHIHMGKLVPIVLSLEHPISKGVARWMLSHSDDQFHKVTDIFNALGVGEDPSNRRKLLKQLRDDGDILKELGIEVGDGPLLKAIGGYKRNKSVWFYNPQVSGDEKTSH